MKASDLLWSGFTLHKRTKKARRVFCLLWPCQSCSEYRAPFAGLETNVPRAVTIPPPRPFRGRLRQVRRPVGSVCEPRASAKSTRYKRPPPRRQSGTYSTCRIPRSPAANPLALRPPPPSLTAPVAPLLETAGEAQSLASDDSIPPAAARRWTISVTDAKGSAV